MYELIEKAVLEKSAVLAALPIDEQGNAVRCPARNPCGGQSRCTVD